LKVFVGSYLGMWAAAAFDRVNVVREVVTEDGAFAGVVPPLLPQEVPGLFDGKVLLPCVVDTHDHHPVDTFKTKMRVI